MTTQQEETEIIELLADYETLIRELMIHMTDPKCECTLKEFLHKLELE